MAETGYGPEEIAQQYYGIITPEAVSEALALIREGFLKEAGAVRRRNHLQPASFYAGVLQTAN